MLGPHVVGSSNTFGQGPFKFQAGPFEILLGPARYTPGRAQVYVTQARMKLKRTLAERIRAPADRAECAKRKKASLRAESRKAEGLSRYIANTPYFTKLHRDFGVA